MLQISMKTSAQRGFSLVEMIVYIAILSVVVSAVVLTALSLMNTFTYLRATQDVAETGAVALERMTREIRFANSINLGASTFSASPGTLSLSTTDDAGNPDTVGFTLSGGRILVTHAGVTAPLSRSTVTISNLTFTHAIGAHGDAVGIYITAQTTVRGTTISKDFRTFVHLDG